ncbi:palmitoyltransferase ZDHHC16B-like [Saccostrea cucullata]|uniref:palmitoyltransferase ZDHHC16B-like n=1 Tax=Saccostrea cuccullata TaxID=36930 RepID=UPI002ED0B76A
MAQVHWRVTEFPRRLVSRCRALVSWLVLLRQTLFYNEFTSYMVGLETAAEPMFWTVDKFSKYFGPIFMVLVVCLTTSVVVIFYICLLPHVYQQSLSKTVFHLIFGHWLLVNIVFNYVMAVFTDPGHPPREVPETVSICKKCISPKPPRAHHCSICDKCVLKMDHHCPWINNCVGYYNHRYFFQFCVFMLSGTIYVCVTGIDLFKQHFYGDKYYPFPAVLYPLNMAYDIIYGDHNKPFLGGIAAVPVLNSSLDQNQRKQHQPGADLEVDMRYQHYHTAVVYEFVLCSAVVIALLLLVCWHVRMISFGETNIEVYINRKEVSRLKKLGLVYTNPYHYGFIKNWQMFFGLGKGRTFLKHVLFPSTHTPCGDGLTFPRVPNKGPREDKDRGLMLL